ncbi:MAG: RCC1 domain-containing protein [Myxococcota bacterium]
MKRFVVCASAFLFAGCPLNPGSDEATGDTLVQTPQVSPGSNTEEDACTRGDCKRGDVAYHGALTCELLGYRRGELKCEDCKVDLSGCVAQGFCGDQGVQGDDEACEVGQALPCKNLPTSLQPADAPYRQGTARCNPLTCMWDRSACRPCTGDSNAGEQCSLGQTQDCHAVDAKYQSGSTASCDALTCQWMTHACHVCGTDAGDQCTVGQTQDCTLFTGENFKQGTSATCDATSCQWEKSTCAQCASNTGFGEQCSFGQTQDCSLLVGENFKQGSTATCDATTCQWEKSMCAQCASNTGLGEQCSLGQTQDCSLLVGGNYKQGSTATCDATTCRWVKSGCSQCTASGGEECAVGQTQSCTALNQLDGKSYYVGQTSSCLSSTCKWDRGTCPYCGDGTVHTDHGEECEGIGAKPCTELSLGDGVNYYGGTAICDACKWDRSACTYCGDQIVQLDEGEMCDFGHGTQRVAKVVTNAQHACILHRNYAVQCRGNQANLNFPQGVTGFQFTDIALAENAFCGIFARTHSLFCQGESAVESGMPSGDGYKQIAAGRDHVCVVGTGDTLTCWGPVCSGGGCWHRSASVSPTTANSVDTVVVSDVRFVDASGNVTCYVKKSDSSVTCFGDDGTVSVPGNMTSDSYRKVAVGGTYACALTAAGGVSCSGTGDGGTGFPTGTGHTDLQAGASFACAVDGNGDATCCGNAGDIANTIFHDGESSVAVLHIFGSGASAHHCTSKTDGTVFCQANNLFNQVPPNFALGPYVRVFAVQDTTFLLDAAGALSFVGQEVGGVGPPVAVSAGKVLDISSTGGGNGFSCAVVEGATAAQGSINCWGAGTWSVPSGSDFVQVAVGSKRFVCGLRAGGGLSCANLSSSHMNGRSDYRSLSAVSSHHVCAAAPSQMRCSAGNLSMNSGGGRKFTASHIVGDILNWAIAAGIVNASGIASEGGSLSVNGRLLNGNVSLSNFYKVIGILDINTVDDLVNVVSRGVGTDLEVCALRQTGEIVCSSANQTMSLMPAPAGVRFADFSLGDSHACGLEKDTGLLYCWGDNAFGQAPQLPLSNQDPAAFSAIQCPPNVTCRACNFSCRLQNVS